MSVTGAGAGIGRRIAIGLAEAGADVGCLDLPGATSAPSAEIEAAGRRAHRVPADVTDAAGSPAAVGAVEARARAAAAGGQQRGHRQRRAGGGDAARQWQR